jgi:hypothetical protein
LCLEIKKKKVDGPKSKEKAEHAKNESEIKGKNETIKHPKQNHNETDYISKSCRCTTTREAPFTSV